MIKFLKEWWKEFKFDMNGNINSEAWFGDGPEWEECPQCLGTRNLRTGFLFSACPLCEGNGHVKVGSYPNYRRV